MITYKTYTISATQIPDRKSLVIKVSEDPNNKELNFQELKNIYRENGDCVDCICFIGDVKDYHSLQSISLQCHFDSSICWPRIAWISDRKELPDSEFEWPLMAFEYIGFDNRLYEVVRKDVFENGKYIDTTCYMKEIYY